MWASVQAGPPEVASWNYYYTTFTSYRGAEYYYNGATWYYGGWGFNPAGGYLYAYSRVSPNYVASSVQISGVVLPSSPSADDGAASGSAVGSAYQTFNCGLGANGIVQVECGKTYTVNTTGFNLASGSLNIVAPPQYRVILNGYPRSSCGLGSTVTFSIVSRHESQPLPGGFASSNPGARIDWHVALGSLFNGESAGSPRLTDWGMGPSLQHLFTPAALQCEAGSDEVFVYRQDNIVRQVFTNALAIDVQTIDENSYEILCYNPPQTTRYPPTTFSGQPFLKYRIDGAIYNSSPPEGGGVSTAYGITITRDTGSRRDVMTITRWGTWPNFSWAKTDWTLEGQTPLVTTAIQGKGMAPTNGSIPARAESISVGSAFALSRHYSRLVFGEAVMAETLGARNSVTANFSYYSDPEQSGNLGYLRSVTTSDGRWEGYEYHDFSIGQGNRAGLLKTRSRPFGNSLSGEATHFEYGPDPFGFNTRPTLVRTTVDGVETSRSATTYDSVAKEGLITATRVDSTGAGSLTTVRQYYSEGSVASFTRGKPYSIQHPDGVKQSFAYGNAWPFFWDVYVVTGAAAPTGTLYSEIEGRPISPVYLEDGKSTMKATRRDGRGRLSLNGR